MVTVEFFQGRAIMKDRRGCISKGPLTRESQTTATPFGILCKADRFVGVDYPVLLPRKTRTTNTISPCALSQNGSYTRTPTSQLQRGVLKP